ncbi:Uu.00g110610.m01.CDS01 [Anthostomella pinea]|uniref:Uu.00g110610.m01.CDS01 n=1 Tax=Anthostomella pinea TaxID=933095 RepID=A0AAI8VEU9_9PEZI|nr:Uu.00g110610.m01.CDS01 [Anthostomella pinea]
MERAWVPLTGLLVLSRQSRFNKLGGTALRWVLRRLGMAIIWQGIDNAFVGQPSCRSNEQTLGTGQQQPPYPFTLDRFLYDGSSQSASFGTAQQQGTYGSSGGVSFGGGNQSTLETGQQQGTFDASGVFQFCGGAQPASGTVQGPADNPSDHPYSPSADPSHAGETSQEEASLEYPPDYYDIDLPASGNV